VRLFPGRAVEGRWTRAEPRSIIRKILRGRLIIGRYNHIIDGDPVASPSMRTLLPDIKGSKLEESDDE
jgi:hypothetical protein